MESRAKPGGHQVNDSYRMPSRSLVKNDNLAMTERADIPRSKFMGSWTRNTTFNAGDLVPFMVEEILPGDQMNYNVTAYLRMSTPLFPLFDNQQVSTFFFFVPNRLVWENWQKFCGEQNSPADSTNYTIPQRISITDDAHGGFAPQSVADHFGLPTWGQVPNGNAISVNALPFRAYNLIWNEWFRDQNLQTPRDVNVTNTADTDELYCARRAKLHDYFTSCLPWPQKNNNPTVPLSGQIPVSGLGFTGGQSWNSTSPTLYQPGFVSGQFNTFTAVPDYGTMYMRGATNPATGAQVYPDVYVDLVNGAGLALQTLRSAIMVQSLYERDARGGTRYTEIVRSHFGVVSPDARLQRPEYLGGGSSPLQLTPIAQTAPSAGAAVGALGAAGTSVGNHSASYAATEHGWIIGLINVQTELSYQQGIPRAFSRRTRFDFYWPALALLGEQAVYKKEIFAVGTPALDNSVFGYQERWAEYRMKYSEVTGTFRSTMTGTIDQWHLSQKLQSGTAVLNGAFITDLPPMSRVLAAGVTATQDGVEYLANIYIQRTAVRPLPMFSTPATLGRF